MQKRRTVELITFDQARELTADVFKGIRGWGAQTIRAEHDRLNRYVDYWASIHPPRIPHGAKTARLRLKDALQ